LSKKVKRETEIPGE